MAADRDYYVRTEGSDPVGPLPPPERTFRTIQEAVDAAALAEQHDTPEGN